MAYIDPDQSQCKTVFRKGTYDSSEDAEGYFQGKRVRVNLTNDAYKQSGFFWCDWHYHCPGDTHPSNPDSIYAPGDKILIECDEEDTPIRVVGFTAGAKACAMFCIALMDGIYLKMYFNEIYRTYNISSALNAAYIDEGYSGHYAGFTTLAVNFAKDYAFRIAVSVQLLKDGSDEYPLGLYGCVIITVDQDDNYVPTVEGVYFYGYGSPNLTPEGPNEYYIPNCDGVAVLSTDTGNTVECPDNLSVNHNCSPTFESTGSLQHLIKGSCMFGGEPEYCCGWNDNPYGDCWYLGDCDNDDLSGRKCLDGCHCDYTLEECGSGAVTSSYSGVSSCEDCLEGSIIAGVYMGAEDIPKFIIANPLYINKIEATFSKSGTLAGGGIADDLQCHCFDETCGAIPYGPYDYFVNDLFGATCSGSPCYVYCTGMKIYYREVSDPNIKGEFNLGIEDAYVPIDLEQIESNWAGTGEQVGKCVGNITTDVWQTLYKYTPVSVFLSFVNYDIFFHTYTKLKIECKQPCTTTGVGQTSELEAYGFSSYTLPSVLPKNGKWNCVQKILTEGQPIFSLVWASGTAASDIVNTNSLGDNLPLASGLSDPLEIPGQVAVLVSAGGAGFAIAFYKGKIKAFSKFERIGDTISPVGEAIYSWNIRFANYLALKANTAFYISDSI